MTNQHSIFADSEKNAITVKGCKFFIHKKDGVSLLYTRQYGNQPKQIKGIKKLSNLLQHHKLKHFVGQALTSNYKTFYDLIDIAMICDKYIISIHSGTKGNKQLDFFIKYAEKCENDTWSNFRKIKHAHWAVDLLIKQLHDPDNTTKLINDILNIYKHCKPIKNNIQRQNLLSDVIKIQKKRHKTITEFGHYEFRFLYIVMHLLSIEEKTGHQNARMFKQLLNMLTDENLDFHSFINKATYIGRRKK